VKFFTSSGERQENFGRELKVNSNLTSFDSGCRHVVTNPFGGVGE
jgi:hypothetical protein